MTTATKTRLRYNVLPALPLVISLLTAGIVVGSSACTVPTGKVAQTVLDVGDAVCEVLTANDLGGNTVKIVCKYIDAADKTSHVFMATVPREQAVRMGLLPTQSAAPSPQGPGPAQVPVGSGAKPQESLPAGEAGVPGAALAPGRSSTIAPVVGSSAKPAASAAPATSVKPAKKP